MRFVFCLFQLKDLLIVVLLKELGKRQEQLQIIQVLHGLLKFGPVEIKFLDVLIEIWSVLRGQCFEGPLEMSIGLTVLGSEAAVLLVQVENSPHILFSEILAILILAIVSNEGDVEIVLSEEEENLLDLLADVILVVGELVAVRVQSEEPPVDVVCLILDVSSEVLDFVHGEVFKQATNKKMSLMITYSATLSWSLSGMSLL